MEIAYIYPSGGDFIMINLGLILLFVFAAAGLTHILVESMVVEPVKNLLIKITKKIPYLGTTLEYMLECYQCMGFWSGLLCGYYLISQELSTVILCGFAGSFISTVSASYLAYLETKTVIELDDE